jgi:hypothetical protein
LRSAPIKLGAAPNPVQGELFEKSSLENPSKTSPVGATAFILPSFYIFSPYKNSRQIFLSGIFWLRLDIICRALSAVSLVFYFLKYFSKPSAAAETR